MIIQLQADADEQELADVGEAISELIEHAEEVELPPAAVGLLLALDDALARPVFESAAGVA
jgi:hypothetical protein